jgi:GT2 family glycosyltransferase
MSAPSVSTPSVSVVICCYTEDRLDALIESLDVLTTQTLRPDRVVVVVDHNTSLHDRLLPAASENPLDVVVVDNRHRRGLSGARNTGVETATGELVAFLDDDATPANRDWLERLVEPYGSGAVWGTGGAAEAMWGPEGRPLWFPDEFGWVVGCSYRGQPTERAEIRNPIGCNMSFRRELFEAVGGFSTGIGRVGRKPVGCEETELCIRAAQQVPGVRFVGEPTAVVEHRVSSERHTPVYFASRCVAEGRSKALVAGRVGATDALSAERTYTTRVLPTGVLRGVTEALRGDLWGLVRSAAIAIGLALTTLGYLHGRIAGHAVEPSPHQESASR